MDRLLFELVQVYTAGATLTLLPLSVPRLIGETTMDSKVVVKKCRQIAGVLQGYKTKISEVISLLLLRTKES